MIKLSEIKKFSFLKFQYKFQYPYVYIDYNILDYILDLDNLNICE